MKKISWEMGQCIICPINFPANQEIEINKVHFPVHAGWPKILFSGMLVALSPLPHTPSHLPADIQSRMYSISIFQFLSLPQHKQQTSSKQSIAIIQTVRVSFNTAFQAEEYRTQKSIFKNHIFSFHPAFKVHTAGATLLATHPLAQHPLLLHNPSAQMKGQDTYDAQR